MLFPLYTFYIGSYYFKMAEITVKMRQFVATEIKVHRLEALLTKEDHLLASRMYCGRTVHVCLLLSGHVTTRI